MEIERHPSKGRHRSIILGCLIAVVMGIYLLLQLHNPSIQATGPRLVNVGQPAPDFAFPLLTGEVVQLSDYRGKVVFLNIWATWCGPCREEMPSMEKLYQKMKGQAFEILAVSVDSQGADVVLPFVKAYKLSLPLLLDREGKIGRLYNTTGVPETFIIDQYGIVVSKIIGYRNWADPKAVRLTRDLAQRHPAKN